MNPLERTRIGTTSLEVTRVGIGTAPLGGMFGPIDDEQATAIIQHAYERGVRLFDTAPLYGYGIAERRLGHGLAGLPDDKAVVSTKVGRLLEPVEQPDRSFFQDALAFDVRLDYSDEGARRSLEASLERLGRERVELLLIHDPDASSVFEQALEGAYPALVELREQGTVQAIGAGMNYVEPLLRFARSCELDCFLLAGRYTLLDQGALAELLPLCVERSISIIVGGVYNSGILADPRPGATFDYAPASPELVKRAQRLRAICARHGVPLRAAALQFPLAHPAVATVLLGVRSLAQLDENLGLLELPIPGELWQELKSEGLLPAEAPVPL